MLYTVYYGLLVVDNFGSQPQLLNLFVRVERNSGHFLYFFKNVVTNNGDAQIVRPNLLIETESQLW